MPRPLGVLSRGSLAGLAVSSLVRLLEHGKAAVRCDTDGSYVPPTVHLFLPRKPNSLEWDADRLKARGFTNDDRNTGLFSFDGSVRAAVLHYAIWDPHALWAKYALHGDFPDAIVGATTAVVADVAAAIPRGSQAADRYAHTAAAVTDVSDRQCRGLQPCEKARLGIAPKRAGFRPEFH